MTFTYTDQDKQYILDAIQDPVKRRMMELIFMYASDGPCLTEKDFNEVQELTRDTL